MNAFPIKEVYSPQSKSKAVILYLLVKNRRASDLIGAVQSLLMAKEPTEVTLWPLGIFVDHTLLCS